jgi:hypothetical protein
MFEAAVVRGVDEKMEVHTGEGMVADPWSTL